VHEPGEHKVVLGDLTVTAIPHSVSPSLQELASDARRSKETKFNVLVLHAGILDSETYKMDEFNEQNIPLSSIGPDWDYVALGHFHKYSKVKENAYYSGSTERLGFGEASQDKGLIEVDLETHKVTFHEIRTREMVDLPVLDASGLASSEILRKVRELMSSSALDDKIVRLIISHVSSDAFKSLDVPSIRRLGGSALHFELRVEREETERGASTGEAHIGLLADEFKKYVTGLDVSDEKKRKLLDLGIVYFSKEEES
jgi:DNA repair exonuclease SbcCD nuclease subunit